ncbi:chromosome partitioning protein ParB [Brachybacterium ginsengisoli]|uniref:Chromosome partitioning protein ParB n=2 Tax=Brachybacterium ginsengisoli TaxID=1331682 RepID=A0A291H1N3_9MICO|nr:chromosome partitioning protein ParB [Brachybacterium ginsengisoli]
MTQKRGLGRGLGALIPGAGSTPAPDQGLRTRTQAPSSSSGESASTRPVDMFFSGESVSRQEENAQRGRAGTKDLATGMARAAAERRGRTAGSSSRRSAAVKDEGASAPADEAEKAGTTRRSAGAKSTASASKTSTAKSSTTKSSTTKSSAAKSSGAKAPASKASPKASTSQATTAKSSTAKKTAPTKSSTTRSTAKEPAKAAPKKAAPARAAAEAAAQPADDSAAITTPSPEVAAPAAPETTAAPTSTPAPREPDPTDAAATEDAPESEQAAPAPEAVEDSPVVDVEAVTPTSARAEESTAAEVPAAEAPAAPEEDSSPSSEEPVADEPEVSEDRGLVSVPGAEFAELPIHEVRENPRNPRTMFDDDELDELAYSLREVGVLQPVVVRPIPVTEDGESFELVMGERRWRAARRAGLQSIPAIIRETSDDDLLRDALLENLHRSQLNPLEEANAYQQLLDDFGCTQDELGDRIGRSRPQITNTLRLLRLPALVQRRLASGAISAGHARALLSLDDPRLMEELAQRIVQEGLSVRAVERLVARGGQQQGPRTVRRSTYDPHVVDLTSRLSNRLEAPVRIDVGKRKGRITLEFTNVEDLERLVENMGLGLSLPTGEHASED